MNTPPIVSAEPAIARVVECYGRRVTIELGDGGLHPAEVFGKRLRVVCGDEALVELAQNGTYQVREVRSRKSELSRTDSRGQAEVLAANLTQLLVLVCEHPETDSFIVDRYLAAAEINGLAAQIVATKADLPRSAQFVEQLSEFSRAGYAVIDTQTGDNTAHLAALRTALAGQVSMLVGESGVGKSSLTNALLGREKQATRDVSVATGEGRHTTVSSSWLRLANGDVLIDSPGVRDFAPPPIGDLQVAFGWREFKPLLGQCKFNNCLHLREPGCAIRSATTDGSLSTRRYESYKRLVNLMRQLRPEYERGP